MGHHFNNCCTGWWVFPAEEGIVFKDLALKQGTKVVNYFAINALSQIFDKEISILLLFCSQFAPRQNTKCEEIAPRVLYRVRISLPQRDTPVHLGIECLPGFDLLTLKLRLVNATEPFAMYSVYLTLPFSFCMRWAFIIFCVIMHRMNLVYTDKPYLSFRNLVVYLLWFALNSKNVILFFRLQRVSALHPSL